MPTQTKRKSSISRKANKRTVDPENMTTEEKLRCIDEFEGLKLRKNHYITTSKKNSLNIQPHRLPDIQTNREKKTGIERRKLK